MQSFYSINNLSFAYPNNSDKLVLDTLSLDIQRGEFLTIIGRSGSGKSTLLHACGGFLKPSGGSVTIEKQLITEPSMKVGYVSQQPSLFVWQTVEENIAFGLHRQGRDRSAITSVVNNLLDVIGLTKQKHYYPAQLSGGMQQRVALARAIAPRPSVLLLDEPFSALDTQSRYEMHKLLLQLWKDNETTVLFVTHDLEEAVVLADRIVILTPRQAHTIAVPFPRPRDQNCRRSSLFEDFLNSVSRRIHGTLN